jgi:hypothetical protein
MFAARDQENLVHGHQQAAASKPLNQNTRGLQPKTPGNKFPKTPLKIPLQDENAPFGLEAKLVKVKDSENLATGKKGTAFIKDDFVTPMGTPTALEVGNNGLTWSRRSSNTSSAGYENNKRESKSIPHTSWPCAREGS